MAVRNVGPEDTDLQIRTQVGPLWSDIFLRGVMPYGKGPNAFRRFSRCDWTLDRVGGDARGSLDLTRSALG
jgi:hypothetical protein